MRGATINGGHFLGISWADLKPKMGTIAPFTSLQNANLKLCSFSDITLKNCNFSKNSWISCYFYHCDFSKSSFAENDFNQSEFENCNLSEANFKTAKNFIINPQSNRVDKARFSFGGALGLLQSFGIIIE